jgi:exodeoxyribonuclease V beta subunit
VIRVRRPAAVEALGRRGVVEASAGTGKTYVLEHLVVDLLLRRGLELEQILVVTFTEKATAELVQRVRGKIATLKDLTADHPLAVEGAATPESECWVLDEQARRRLRAALLAFDRAGITTIHGFCQRLLVEHAFAHQRLFDEELVDESDTFHDAFVETLRHEAAVDPALAPYLDAWLRTGKPLEALELRWLFSAHRQGDRPLRPPPLDEAAFVAALASLPEVSDEDALLALELKRYRVHGGTIKKVVRLLAGLGRVAALQRGGAPAALCLAQLEIEERQEDNNVLPYLCEKLGHIPADGSRSARLLAAVRAIEASAVPLGAELVRRILPRLRVRLESRKRQTGLYDFQDMLTLVARGLEGERGESLVATLRARYRHALIDEFQDTDETQWRIFRRLFLDSDSHGLTVIGDPKQAIYSFRGADVHTYLRARAEILGATPPLHLTESFRSTAPLIAAYNALLDQEAPAPFFRASGGIRYDHPVVCGRPTLRLTDASGAEAAPVVVLDVVNKTADQSSLYTWQVKQAVQGRIVAEIRALLSAQGRLFLDGKPLGAGDVFVLTRTTRESREVGDALRAAGLPYAFFKQERLFATVEAREVLDLLRAIDTPDDTTARSRAFITAFFGLSLPDLAACEDLPTGHPLQRLLYEWKALADAGDFEALFARIVAGSGIVCRELFLRASERRLTNYLHLLELLQDEAARTRSTLRELSQTLAAWVSGARRPPGQGTDIQRLETDAQAVQIMTIHHAKGLEAGAVFLYGAFWPGPAADVRAFHDEADQPVVRLGRPPAAERQRIADEQDDEERRVLYVALTRARGRLYMPVYPASFKGLRGSYRRINERLEGVCRQSTVDGRQLFELVEVGCPAAPVVEERPGAAEFARWEVPDLGGETDDSARRGQALARAGFVVTSYSAIKRRHAGEAVDDPAAGEETPAEDTPLPPDELPRGRLSGSFLHECIEELPWDDLRERPPLAAWQARPEIVELFERVRRRHDREPAHLPHALRLVHTTLTAPVRLGEVLMPGLCTADRAIREMEFLFPIPERAEGWRIERGVVKGFVDLLFEHQGRTYVCDWKGDWLRSWDAATVDAHCARHYQTQAQLYTVAALRLLGVTDRAAHERRFGGVLYCFLRGRRPEDPGAGVHFHRPDWDEVQRWQREMLGDAYWRLS